MNTAIANIVIQSLSDGITASSSGAVVGSAEEVGASVEARGAITGKSDFGGDEEDGRVGAWVVLGAATQVQEVISPFRFTSTLHSGSSSATRDPCCRHRSRCKRAVLSEESVASTDEALQNGL